MNIVCGNWIWYNSVIANGAIAFSELVFIIWGALQAGKGRYFFYEDYCILA
ncbi:hypothetical protein PMH09_09350 [Roseofilum sp. BLCC_M143]|uniref:Uncharacterized protein n=1 Tax=Roseofilum casamattae BLCC-M143 TaxID=3022442 RepID=A0ABT7BW30_9CYAN|nr:hypothetical protein [Roseofilum casamattae BLCC-M143]